MTSQKFLVRVTQMFPNWTIARIKELLTDTLKHIDSLYGEDTKVTPTEKPVDFTGIK